MTFILLLQLWVGWTFFNYQLERSSPRDKPALPDAGTAAPKKGGRKGTGSDGGRKGAGGDGGRKGAGGDGGRNTAGGDGGRKGTGGDGGRKTGGKAKTS